MAAICGLVDFTEALDVHELKHLLREVVNSAAHRAPDGVQQHFEAGQDRPGHALAHLAFHTTSEANCSQQPCSNADASVFLIADARIDNRADLSQRLGARSLGDAELILEAYLRWGQDCPGYLVGDFAFVVWDRQHRSLFAATDPMGVRSLHYARLKGRIAFATEAQQLLQLPGLGDELDELTVAAFLAGELQLPRGRTFFRGIRSLPGGHALAATAEKSSVRRHWQPQNQPRLVYRDAGEYPEHLLELLDLAVTDRLSSCHDLVGATLSGGLDSTTVTAVAQRSVVKRSSGTRIAVVSVVFDQLPECDERRYIQAVLEMHDLEASFIRAEDHWILGDSEAFAPRPDTPMLGWESCFREMFGYLKHRGARVVLGGHGGDDVFGGSLHADRTWRRFGWRELSKAVRRARNRRGSVIGELVRQWLTPFLPDPLERGLRRLLGRTPRSGPIPIWLSPSLLQRSGFHEWQRREESSRRRRGFRKGIPYSPDSMGRHPGTLWLDRCAARWGMEPRHPLLDRRIVEFALSIPPGELIGEEYKSLLRQATRGVLPELVRRRQDKSNVAAFFDFSLREKKRAAIEKLFEQPLSAELGMVDRDQVQRSFRDHCTGSPTQQSRKIWYAICLERWLQHRAGNRA